MSANWLYVEQDENKLLNEILLYEQHWVQDYSLVDIQAALDNYVVSLKAQNFSGIGTQNCLYDIIDYIFDELAFSGPGAQALPESSLACLSYCVMYRTGNPISLTIVLAHLLNEVGFNADIIEIDYAMALVVKLSSAEVIIIDPVSGASEYIISSDDTRNSLINEMAHFSKSIPQDELLKEILTEQKIALLEEGLFQQALNCVEALMALLPEDPYERRDRGLVLKQLDCDKWAKDDFDYFIQACPNDPMAAFIKAQLEEHSSVIQTIH